MQITPEVLKVLNMLVKPLTMLVCAHRQLFYNSEFRWLQDECLITIMNFEWRATRLSTTLMLTLVKTGVVFRYI